MTELLREAIAQIEKLPADQQDAIAARFLAELQDEQKWEAHFASTTDDEWDQMAAMVRQEIAEGKTVPLSEVRSIATSIIQSKIADTGIEVPEPTHQASW